MNLLSIYLMQSCNINCYYCPMKPWIYPLDHKVFFRGGLELPDGLTEEEKEKHKVSINLINNEDLLKWVDEFCPPDKWVVEFTGGEPALHSEFSSKILPAFCERGYKGVTKTNGTLYIPKTENFKMVTAWHESIKEIPPYHDFILIIKNPNDNWREKKQYCEDNKIPFCAVPFDRSYEGKKSNAGSVLIPNKMQGMTRILSMGQITSCYADAPQEGYDIFAMKPPKIKDVKHGCSKCGNVTAVEIFLPGGLIYEKFNIQ